ncbi:MAG: gliding motility-associated ABC transporter substrate-binding protein GldG [Bacteroidota bacterium]
MGKKSQTLIRLLVLIAIIIFVNLIGDSFFTRIDLTKEKRYSLSDLSVQTARWLDYPMLVTVYLEGDFPPNIRNYQEAIRTMLIEMKQYAGRNLEYNFVDPSNNPDLIQSLKERGFLPIPIKVRVSATETKQQFMWPVVRFGYRDREVFVDLIKGASVLTTQGPNVNFVKAEEDLEYRMVSSIRKLTKEDGGGVIGLLQGHGELPPDQIAEFLTEIQKSYNVYTLSLSNTPNYEISPSIDVLLILRPTEAFSERDKYEIDQYLMRGGSILWLVNEEKVDLNTYQKQATLSEILELNLDDMFFQYGFKLNADLIQDLECEATEVFEPASNTFLSKKYPYFPLVYNFPQHPITRNVDATLLRYASSIDTFQQEGVKKTVFMTTSPLSRTLQGKQFIDINSVISDPPAQALFNRPNRITGVLMEGVFESVFNGREAPIDSIASSPPSARFGARNNPVAPGSMVLISDDEFALGKEYQGRRQFLPYDNKSLLMNAIDYLAGDEALTSIRSKSVVERRLSRTKVQQSAVGIRLLNLVVPILLILLFGVVRWYMRKRKHEKLRIS